MTAAEPFAINYGWSKVLTDEGWHLRDTELRGMFGPSGLAVRVQLPGGDRGSVIVSQSEWGGVEYLHASLALQLRTPSYEELALLHRAVFGRKRYAYQVFAPGAQHVNIHENALHLWGRADGRPVLPEFGQFGTI